MDKKDAPPFSKHIDKAIVTFILIFTFATTFSIAVTQIAYFTALALWLFKTIYCKRFSVRPTALDYFFLAYLIVESISAWLAYYPPQAWFIWQKRIMLIPIVYLLTTYIEEKRYLRWSVAAFLISALGVSLYGVYTIVKHLTRYFAFEERLGLFQYPLTASGIMMYAMLLALAFVIYPETPRKYRIAALLALFPMLLNLIFTFSRSSWFGFLGGAIVLAVVRTKKLLYALIILIVLFALFATPQLKDRALSSFDPSHPANAPRVVMWKIGINIFEHNPWFGVGDIGIEKVYPLYAPSDAGPEGHLHNNIIMWLATVGSIGFIVLVSLFVRLLMVEWKVYAAVQDDWFYGALLLGTVASGIAFHINGLFEWNFGDAEIITIIWMMTGWTFAIQRLKTLPKEKA